MIAVKIKRLIPEALVPEQKTDGSAGFDVKVPVKTRIRFGLQKIGMGIAFEMPRFLRMDNRSRSGYTLKGMVVVDYKGNPHRILAFVKLGLIDSDYRGEVASLVHAFDPRLLLPWKRYYIERGQSLSQLVFTKVPDVILYEHGTLDETLRGEKGFGGADNE